MQHYLRLDQDASVVQETDWVVGASLLLRRSLYEELGGFDPRFFLFFEDIDLCRRVRQSGKTVVYYPIVTASDQKKRLSEGGIGSLIFKKTGRAHILSAFSYFWKWR